MTTMNRTSLKRKHKCTIPQGEKAEIISQLKKLLRDISKHPPIQMKTLSPTNPPLFMVKRIPRVRPNFDLIPLITNTPVLEIRPTSDPLLLKSDGEVPGVTYVKIQLDGNPFKTDWDAFREAVERIKARQDLEEGNGDYEVYEERGGDEQMQKGETSVGFDLETSKPKVRNVETWTGDLVSPCDCTDDASVQASALTMYKSQMLDNTANPKPTEHYITCCEKCGKLNISPNKHQIAITNNMQWEQAGKCICLCKQMEDFFLSHVKIVPKKTKSDMITKALERAKEKQKAAKYQTKQMEKTRQICHCEPMQLGKLRDVCSCKDTTTCYKFPLKSKGPTNLLRKPRIIKYAR